MSHQLLCPESSSIYKRPKLKVSTDTEMDAPRDVTLPKSSDRHDLKGGFGSLGAKISTTPKPIFIKSRGKLGSKNESIEKEANQERTRLGAGIGYLVGQLFKNQDWRGKLQSERLSPSFSDLFLALPNELVLEIITPLPIHDILGLRLVSKAFHALITFNEHPISTYHSQHSLPPYTLQLYPLPGPAKNNLRYFCSMWHRLKVSATLASHIANYAAEHMFLRTAEEQQHGFESEHRRMTQRLLPLVFVLFHYLETSRDLHVHHLASGAMPLNRQAYVLNPLQCQVMRKYSDQILLESHQAFRLILSVLSRHLRPEMYVGAIERSKNGYANDSPSHEAFVAILTIGGPRQVQKLWEVEGYKNRRDEIDHWYRSIRTPDEALPLQTPNTISRLYTLGRGKKSTKSVRDKNVHGTNCTDWFCVKPACNVTHHPNTSDNLVFHSSLSSGPPMGPLQSEQLQSLLPDLPLLRDLWTPAAEVLLLERGVVKSTQEIKQNSHVLSELIKEGETETDRCFSLGTSAGWFL